MEPHLFDTRLNEQGKNFLARIHKWAKFFYACTIVTCVFDLINAYFAFRNYQKFYTNFPALIKFQEIISIIFLIIYPVLLVCAGYFFYRFANKSVTAVQFENELEYNGALQFLLKHILVATVLFALNSVWAFIIIYTQIKMSNP